MHLEILHATRYTYDRNVQLLPHLLYLRPRAHPGLDVHGFSLTIKPPADVQWMRDDFDNLPAAVQFREVAGSMEITTACLVSTEQIPPFGFLVRDYAARFPFSYEALHRFNLAPYLELPDVATSRQIFEWMNREYHNPPSDTVGWLFGLNQLVSRSFSYVRRDEEGMQAPLATLDFRSGSCRDFAVFLIACLRTHGVAARFVSGYLYDAADCSGSHSAMHAWVETFLPGAGWKGLDPTHGLFCDEAYVPIAHAAIAESVNPIQGSFFSCIPAVASMTTEVRVRRLARASPSGISPLAMKNRTA